MKYFVKIFLLLLIVFSLVSTSFIYKTYTNIKDKNESYLPNYDQNWYDASDLTDSNLYESYNELINAINTSHKVNFLVLGLEWPRTDTIMLVSFDEKTKDLDIISIPRDTYYYKEGFRSGFDDVSEYKLNAIYGDEGPEGVVLAVEDLMNIPIDYYVTITYSGVANIVDSIGGVEVTIPFDMYYEDNWDDPPLIIDLKEGQQVLNGEKAIQFLRFRQNKDGSIKYGDIQRIKAQQQFISSAIDKTLSFKLPKVIKEVFYSVRTDASLLDILSYADSALGISMDNINMITAPGDAYYENGVSFYKINDEKMNVIIYSLYGVEIMNNAEN